ncbi:MAG: hypothetical protein WA160_16795, partial [Pseudobdellovibrio sp.]
MKQFIILILSSFYTVHTFAQTPLKTVQAINWKQTSASIADKNLVELFSRLKSTPSKFEPNYFQKIRLELNRLAAEEQQLAKTQGIIKHSLIKLPVDTAGFFIATGAVNFMTMWTAAGTNPLLFQEQVENLKDPLATLSFYSFMVANGIFIDFKTKNLSPETKALAMRRLSYMGMAAGSLASSIVSDVGTSIKACANSWLITNPKNNSVTTQSIKDDSDHACDQANEIWSARNLTEKYTPQIFSLLVVQGATELVQSGVQKGIAVSAKALYSTLLAAGKKAGFEMLFVNVLLSANPARASVQAISIIGKITQFTFFVGVDHVLNNTLTRGFNNLFKPLIFKALDQHALDSYFEIGGKYQWDITKISTLKAKFDPSSRDDKNSAEGLYSFENFKTEFPKNIENFTTQLQVWRNHLNSDVEQDLNSWLNLTNRMISQLQVSQVFYDTYLKSLFDLSNVNYRITLPEDNKNKLTTKAYNNISTFPNRPLPLYGVRFQPWKDSNLEEKNAYLAEPALTEKMQSQFLVTVASVILKENKVKSFHMRKSSEVIANQTLEAMLTGVPMEQGRGLKKFMTAAAESVISNDVELRAFSKYLKELIGNPSPRLEIGEGYPAAFEIEKKEQYDIANFDTTDSTLKVNFNDPGTYLLHAMVCGSSEGYIKERGTDFSLFNISTFITASEPDFLAPTIVNQPPKEICAKTSTGVNSINFYSKELTNSENNIKYKNITEYISQNIKMSVLGDYRDKTKNADFSKWWSQHVMKNIPATLEKWDKGYSEIVQKSMDNIFDTKTIGKSTLDNLTQFNWMNDNLLGSSLVDSYRFEKEFYLQTIHLVKSKSKFNLPFKGDVSILNEAKYVSLGQKSAFLKPLTDAASINVTNSLNALIAELSKPVTKLRYKDQIKPDEEIDSIKNGTELNYKRYLTLKDNFENAVVSLEENSGCSNKLKNLFSDPFSASTTLEKTNSSMPMVDISDKSKHNLE